MTKVMTAVQDLAIKYALNYSISIAVIYDHLTDENNPKYDLNRQLIKEQKGKITIINRNNFDSIIKNKLSEKPVGRNSQPFQTRFC